MKSRFLLLATNPPFGSNKYRWNNEIAESLPYEVLAEISLRGSGDTADPSELFFFRTLDLLVPGGLSRSCCPMASSSRKALGAVAIYERVREASLHVAAIVSLPSVTFALGGTVAKTSFVIVQKQVEPEDKPLYVAVAHHVGFVKRGKKRADDPSGNDLLTIAEEFGSDTPTVGRLVESWRNHESFAVARLIHTLENGTSSHKQTPLAKLVEMVRNFQTGAGTKARSCFHVSVLDVDATG